MFRKYYVFIVIISLFLSIIKIENRAVAAINSLPTILIISSEEYTSEEKQLLEERLFFEGFQAQIVVVPPNCLPEETRQAVKDFNIDNQSFNYVVIDSILKTGEIKDIKSDYYFTDFDKNISVSRATKEEFFKTLLKKPVYNNRVLLAMPILSYYRWLEGCCRYRLKIDPSFLAREVSLKFSKHFFFNTLFEKEGVDPSPLTPTAVLNEENFKKFFQESFLVFALTTYEPIGKIQDPGGSYDMAIREFADRALWAKDADNNKYITDDELEIKTFFNFDLIVDQRKMGIFPQFQEDKINIDIFSTFVCSSDPFNDYVNLGRNNGMSRGMLFVWRHFLEEIMKGKTFGQAWSTIPSLIDEKFPLEGKFMPETVDFLRLRVKGLPFISMPTIRNVEIDIPDEIFVNQEMILENKGNEPVVFHFEENEIISFNPEKGILLPKEIVKISFKKKVRSYDLKKYVVLATEPSRKQHVYLRIWLFNSVAKDFKLWYYKWKLQAFIFAEKQINACFLNYYLL